MSKEIISYIVLFVVLVLLQVMVLNHISVMGYGIPLLYIYFILVLPASLSPNWVVTLGFLLGLTIDLFCDTPGMNALASTVTSAVRQPMLSMYISREDVPVAVPSAHSLGMGVFLKYALVMVLIQNVLIYTIEAFTIFHYLTLLLKIVSGTFLSFILIIGIESLKLSKSEK